MKGKKGHAFVLFDVCKKKKAVSEEERKLRMDALSKLESRAKRFGLEATVVTPVPGVTVPLERKIRRSAVEAAPLGFDLFDEVCCGAKTNNSLFSCWADGKRAVGADSQEGGACSKVWLVGLFIVVKGAEKGHE